MLNSIAELQAHENSLEAKWKAELESRSYDIQEQFKVVNKTPIMPYYYSHIQFLESQCIRNRSMHYSA